MRRLPTNFALIAGIMCFVGMALSLFSPARANGPGQISLMETLAEWKYPDSKMLGGASMSDGGNRMFPSIKWHAILTTADPIEKVVDFYSKKLVRATGAILPSTKAEDLAPDSNSVSIQDDSQGRPLTLRIIDVHRADTSTTLVISRTHDEKVTHIAWSHDIRLGKQ